MNSFFESNAPLLQRHKNETPNRVSVLPATMQPSEGTKSVLRTDETISAIRLLIDRKMSQVREQMERINNRWTQEEEEDKMFNLLERVTYCSYQLSELRNQLNVGNAREIAAKLSSDPNLNVNFEHAI
jgi:hypothetical protein